MMTFSMMTFSMMTFSMMTDIQHDDIQHDDIQHNDIQHNYIQHKDILGIIAIAECTVFYCFLCLYAEYHYTNCRGALFGGFLGLKNAEGC